MNTNILVRANDTNTDELFNILSESISKFSGISVKKPSQVGLAADFNTLVLEILQEITKIGVPILISSIGLAWKNYHNKKNKHKSTLIIETDLKNISVDLTDLENMNQDSSLTINFPDKLNKIIRIRLE